MPRSLGRLHSACVVWIVLNQKWKFSSQEKEEKRVEIGGIWVVAMDLHVYTKASSLEMAAV